MKSRTVLEARAGLARARGWVQRQPQVLQDARALARTSRSARSVAYLGFAGQRNLGDDAIHDAHERWTVGAEMVDLPVHHTQEVLRRVPGRPLPKPVLLGGGTLVGRADWLARIEAYERAGWATSWTLMGVGVEDPEFSGRHVHASWDDLRAWARVLPRFGEVTVRGPLSQRTLAAVGVESKIVGDPALLFAGRRAPVPVQEDLVAMSVAVPEDVWGGDPSVVVEAMADVAASWRVAQAVARPEAVEILQPPTIDVLLDVIAPCAVMIGQRLHAVVLASAVDVPSLAIEYRPKCLDFQLSVGRGDWTVSTRGISAAGVLEPVMELLAAREKHSVDVNTGVKRLLDGLVQDGGRVRERTRPGLPSTWAARA
jgi:hypothetical protein